MGQIVRCFYVDYSHSAGGEPKAMERAIQDCVTRLNREGLTVQSFNWPDVGGSTRCLAFLCTKD